MRKYQLVITSLIIFFLIGSYYNNQVKVKSLHINKINNNESKEHKRLKDINRKQILLNNRQIDNNKSIIEKVNRKKNKIKRDLEYKSRIVNKRINILNYRSSFSNKNYVYKDKKISMRNKVIIDNLDKDLTKQRKEIIRNKDNLDRLELEKVKLDNKENVLNEQEIQNKTIFNKLLLNINTKKVVENSKTFIRPLKKAVVSASAWYYPSGGWHPAIDLAAPINTPIVAPANGVILARGISNSYGNYMVSAHQIEKDTYTFIYAHMNRKGWGTSVKQGQQIGVVGSTGNSTGPHLHFEVFRHSNTELNDVINKFKRENDLFFGLGYNSTGSCSGVCRLNPNEFINLKQGQSY